VHIPHCDPDNASFRAHRGRRPLSEALWLGVFEKERCERTQKKRTRTIRMPGSISTSRNISRLTASYRKAKARTKKKQHELMLSVGV
jgi:hypothetical protein